jgi:hypothetical protein
VTEQPDVRPVSIGPRIAAACPPSWTDCTMHAPDYDAFFRDYAAAYQRSLGASVDTTAIRAFFAEGFVGAGPNCQVKAAANDDAFEKSLQQGYAFYKALGTRSMAVERVESEPLFEGHDKVRVFYRAGYERQAGATLSIAFDVVYLVQRRPQGAKIFAFVAGDEMALYRKHGLIDEAGEPT